MTPYELRFEIFKQAYNMLNDQFSIEMDTARYWNANSSNTVKMDYPEFPTLSTPAAGLEPATSGLTVQRNYQLC